MKEIPPHLIEKIRSSKRIRQKVAFEDPLWFSLLYLRHHFKFPFAPFHLEMYHLVRQTDINFIVVMAFRESGKSTVMNMANILWSILGKPEKKFVVIISKTQEQAKNHFANIKSELMHNESLKEDFGPFIETAEQRSMLSLELVYHGSKILSIAREQGVRGLKYQSHRPDLILCDDVEDTLSVAEEAGRERLNHWFENEVLPLGSGGTRIVVLGNLLSDDSLIVRLKKEITNRNYGIFRAYPLIDDYGKCLWSGRFPSKDNLQELKKKFSDDTWTREYLLDSTYQRQVPYPDQWTKEMFERLEKEAKEAFRRYRESLELNEQGIQIPLIEAMKEFRISAPIIKSDIPRSRNEELNSDPRYIAYTAEAEKIVKKAEKELIKYLSTKRPRPDASNQ